MGRKRSLNPLEHEVIDPKQLPNLHKYKYSGADFSLIGNHIMQHYWSNAVKLLPMTIAPNLITLIGFMISTSSSALIAYYQLLEGGEYPNFVWYYACFALFMYQTLDALDGKQARRTKTGSPMGELFDHGCDAFFTPLLQYNICCALGLGGLEGFTFFLLICSGLFFTIWEQFSTTALTMGYVNGPTDGLLITMVVFFMTGRNGSTYWTDPMEASVRIGYGDFVWESTCLRDFLYLFILVSGGFTILTNFVHVLLKERSRSLASAAAAVLPMIAIMASMFAVAYNHPVALSAHPFVVEVLYGLVFSFSATRMTVARLCAVPFNPFSGVYLSVAALNALLFLPFGAEEDRLGYFAQLSVIVLLYSLWQYLHMMIAVFRQFSEFLGINVLSLTPKQLQKIKQESSSASPKR